jgi:hypothetical protein
MPLPPPLMWVVIGAALGCVCVCACAMLLYVEQRHGDSTPQCNWRPRPTTNASPSPSRRVYKFAAFLSHYKAECAATARILHRELQQMLGCDVFLECARHKAAAQTRAHTHVATCAQPVACIYSPCDMLRARMGHVRAGRRGKRRCCARGLCSSSDLTDLRKLFSRGLEQSEVLVLLCSPNVLTRPWCLLELWEAHRHAIPVVPVRIAAVPGQPSFDDVAMLALLTKLEVALDQHTPGAFALVQEHIQAQGATVDDLKRVLLQATGLAQKQEECTDASDGVASNEKSQLRQLTWDPSAPDLLMTAATQRLVDRMATVTNRKLRWRSQQASSALLSSGLSRLRLGRSSANVTRERSIGFVRGRGSHQYFISYYRAEAGGPCAAAAQPRSAHTRHVHVMAPSSNLATSHAPLSFARCKRTM